MLYPTDFGLVQAITALWDYNAALALVIPLLALYMGLRLGRGFTSLVARPLLIAARYIVEWGLTVAAGLALAVAFIRFAAYWTAQYLPKAAELGSTLEGGL